MRRIVDNEEISKVNDVLYATTCGAVTPGVNCASIDAESLYNNRSLLLALFKAPTCHGRVKGKQRKKRESDIDRYICIFWSSGSKNSKTIKYT